MDNQHHKLGDMIVALHDLARQIKSVMFSNKLRSLADELSLYQKKLRFGKIKNEELTDDEK